jgi:hypothetical protein
MLSGFAEWSRRDASDTDWQPARVKERERTSQTPYNYSFFVIRHSDFVIEGAAFLKLTCSSRSNALVPVVLDDLLVAPKFFALLAIP